IYFDLPGVDKDSINLKVEKDILTLTGDCTKKPAEGFSCTREEMEYFGYRRSFNLNKTVDADKIAADYDNGALKVKLPKREEQKTKEIKISIS
ncbi:MAG: Hsp20/alpha crystallin family protein, partial [Spirochaetes bacterium]|nr:Hsp20/alpha crystallin family protein [Spirochaetota bacterium]